ncbi:MAG TPA: DinB family protein [Planctomycetota bacterium]|nr:DinB family protein [Planctomycetota bacterium]
MPNPSRRALLDRYSEGPSVLEAALRNAPEECRRWRPGPGKWSVHEIVVHCADAEMNAAMRIRYLLAESSPTIVGYDQDRWAIALDYHAQPLDEALAAIRAARAHTCALIRRLPDEAWSRRGTHTESGPYDGDAWLGIYARHLEEHAAQIDRTAAAWRAGRERAASG